MAQIITLNVLSDGSTTYDPALSISVDEDSIKFVVELSDGVHVKYFDKQKKVTVDYIVTQTFNQIFALSECLFKVDLLTINDIQFENTVLLQKTNSIVNLTVLESGGTRIVYDLGWINKAVHEIYDSSETRDAIINKINNLVPQVTTVTADNGLNATVLGDNTNIQLGGALIQNTTITIPSTLKLTIASASDPNTLVITDTGNIGIGTSAPGTNLILARRDQNASTVFQIQNLTSGFIANAGIFAVTDNGQGGINAFSSGFVVPNFAGRTHIQTTQDGLDLLANNVVGNIRFFSGGEVERMTIDATGNVGIGDAAPTFKLTLSSTTATDGISFIHLPTVDTGQLFFQLQGGIIGNVRSTARIDLYDSGSPITNFAGNTIWSSSYSGTTAGEIWFASENGTAGNQPIIIGRLTSPNPISPDIFISPIGNVGFHTSMPSVIFQADSTQATHGIALDDSANVGFGFDPSLNPSSSTSVMYRLNSSVVPTANIVNVIQSWSTDGKDYNFRNEDGLIANVFDLSAGIVNTLTVQNGLTDVGTANDPIIELGGTLLSATNINQNSNVLSFTNSQIGINTTSPVAGSTIHMREVSTTTDLIVRLDVDSTSAWDLVAQATGPRFEIRDVLNATIPFKINEASVTNTLVIDPLGVGIGTATPGAQLQVDGDAIYNLGVDDFIINSTGQSNLLFVDGGTDNVAIGTGIAGSKFTILNTVAGQRALSVTMGSNFPALFTNSTNAGVLEMSGVATTTTVGALKVTNVGAGIAGYFINLTDSSIAVRADTGNGRAFVGQTSTGSTFGTVYEGVGQGGGGKVYRARLGGSVTAGNIGLEIIKQGVSDGDVSILQTFITNIATDNTKVINHFKRGSGGVGVYTNDHFLIEETTATNTGNSFHVKQDSVTKFVIDSTGQVGINQATPSALLHLNSSNTVETVSQMKIEANSGSAAATFATLEFLANATGAATSPVGRIKAFAPSPAFTAATMTFQTIGGGPSFVNTMSLKGGQVGIGTESPTTSAVLDIVSTAGALLIPRMTTTQKNALTAVNGMIVYDSTLNKFQGYENGAWTSFI